MPSSRTAKGWALRGHVTAPRPLTAEAAARLVTLAPHSFPHLARFDYAIYVHSHAVLNPPATFEAISKHLSSTGASVAFVQVRQGGAGETRLVLSAVILRRMTVAAAALGNALYAAETNEPSSLSQQPPRGRARKRADGATRGLLLGGDVIKAFVPHIALMPPDAMRDLLTTSAALPRWWHWWTCRSVCCKPNRR